MDVDVKAQDIPSMEIGRNFANKIWNAGRFLLMNKDNIFHDDTTESNFKQTLTQSELSFTDKWILSKYNTTIRNIGNSLDNYKVNDYSKILFDFIWRDFCDWYVEVMKVQINNSANIEYKKKLISFAIDLYDKILILQHPIMPFITEEIWHLLDEDRTESQSISLLNYPVSDENIINITIEENFALLQSIVEEIRALRAGVNIPPKIAVEIIISCKDSITVEFIKSQTEMIQTLGKCSLKECDINLSKPNNSLSSIYRENEIFMILDSSIDLDKERLRLNKEIERLERNIGGSEKKISNPGFVAKAGDDIVNYEKEKLQSMKESLLKVKSNLESLVK
jgi:valyl-tRNA synthetase